MPPKSPLGRSCHNTGVKIQIKSMTPPVQGRTSIRLGNSFTARKQKMLCLKRTLLSFNAPKGLPTRLVTVWHNWRPLLSTPGVLGWGKKLSDGWSINWIPLLVALAACRKPWVLAARMCAQDNANARRQRYRAQLFVSVVDKVPSDVTNPSNAGYLSINM